MGIIDFFKQTKSSTIIVFTVILILLLKYTPPLTWNNYHHIFVIILLLVSLYMFYKTTSTEGIINPLYGKIQQIINILCAITLFILFYVTDPGGLISKYSGQSSLFAILFMGFLALYFIITLSLPSGIKERYITYLMGFFGIIISALFIAWICYISLSYSGSAGAGSGASGWVSLFINLLIIIIILMLILKTINTTFPYGYGNKTKNGIIELLKNTILYLPCLFSSILNRSVGGTTGVAGLKTHIYESAQNIRNTQNEYWVLLAALAGLYGVYYFLPDIKNEFITQNGNVLINEPVSLNQQKNIASYEELNGDDADNKNQIYETNPTTTATTPFKYQYALSCWIYIDAMPPNMNPSYTHFTSLLNYGNKPCIQYHGETNTLKIIVTTHKNGTADKEKVFMKKDIPLQKWINILVNYTGDNCDIFMDNQLVGSIDNVASYMHYDMLSTGTEGGIYGKICSVIYYKRALTTKEMYYLYNLLKGGNPPALEQRKFYQYYPFS